MRLLGWRTCRISIIKYLALSVSVYLFLSIMGLLFTRPSVQSHRSHQVIPDPTVLKGSLYNGAHPEDQSCEIIHLGLVLLEPGRVSSAVDMVKTLLHHRHNPLNLHLVASHHVALIVNTLMTSWELPSVKLNVYPLKDEISASDISSFKIKMMMHAILPESISKVFAIDDRLRFLVDIYPIWESFRDFTNEQMLGIHPADKENKFYTDALLMDLKMMRKHPKYWSQSSDIKTWDEVFHFISKHNNSLHVLPCSWQVRLQPSFNISQCLGPSQPKVLWWDTSSPNFYTQHREVERQKLVTNSIILSDGEIYRYSPIPCGHHEPTHAPIHLPSLCREFRLATRLKRRTHIYVYGDPHKMSSKDLYDVSLVTQLTPDRFGVFERMVGQWEGPIHAVFHVTEEEGQRLPHLALGSAVLNKRTNVAFHAVYKRGVFNPINYLRNVGINESRTPYTFFVDVDLVPNKHIYSSVKNAIEKYMNNKNTVLVVPSFEALVPLQNFPNTKTSLLGFLKNKTVEGYRMSKGWNLGHRPTNFPKWINTTVPYQVVFQDAFEPYVVVRTSEQPQFEESLLERMGDKLAYGRIIYARGYEFWVLPDQYVIHLPHPMSHGTNMWKRYKGYGRCGGVLFEEFRAATKRKYPDQKVH